MLQQALGASTTLVTTSCTHVLEIATQLMEIEPGDETIAPSFTFVSPANAFVMRGAKPVFGDIRPDMLNPDETKLAAFSASRTRAIVPVHYTKVGCVMDTIIPASPRRRRGQCPWPFRKTPSSLARHARRVGRSELPREKKDHLRRGRGVPRQRPVLCRTCRDHPGGRHQPGTVFRRPSGQISLGRPRQQFVMSNVLAAFLYAQLETWTTIQARRKMTWVLYHAGLQSWARVSPPCPGIARRPGTCITCCLRPQPAPHSSPSSSCTVSLRFPITSRCTSRPMPATGVAFRVSARL